MKIRYRQEEGTVLVEVPSSSRRREGRSEGVRGSAAALMHLDVMRSRQDSVVNASVTSVTNVQVFTGRDSKQMESKAE